MSDWKDKLESITKIPGEPLDKNQAWEKLYARLDKKPAKRKTPLYWSAAAAIFVTALFVVFQYRSSVNEIPTEMVKQKIEQSQPSRSPIVEEINPEVTVISGEKHKSEKPLNRKSESTQLAKTTISQDTILVNNNSADTANLLLANVDVKEVPVKEIVQPKKRMKVIHVNEMGNMREDVIMAQRQSNARLFFNKSTSTTDFSLPAPQNNAVRIGLNSTN